MKRIFCLILSALLALSLCPGGFAESQVDAPHCVDLTLECNPSTGYAWQAVSSDEEIAYVQDLGITAQEEDEALVGAGATAAFRIRGAAAGEAEVTFSYARSWEEGTSLSFTVPVMVDTGLNVLTGSEISLPREDGAQWAFETLIGREPESALLEVTDQGENVFSLRPLALGAETVKFTRFSGGEPLPGVFLYRVECAGDSLRVYEIEYRTSDQPSFAPAVSFTTTDFEGNTVTEQIFAGHSLTIPNFWEPWCGPCVAELPFLQQLSQEYADRGVQVVGVFSTPDADEDVRLVLERRGVTYPILRYVQEFDSMQTGYVPTTVVLDGTGAIVYGPTAGALNYAGWCALVEELL